MTALRIFATARPSLIGARVQPIDPREQWALDELARRRKEAAQREAEAKAGRGASREAAA